MSKDKKKLILKNSETGEERPMVRCGMIACNRVIHLGEDILYDSNYDVYCDDCEDECGFVQRGTLDDDWISGDCGWEEVEDKSPAEKMLDVEMKRLQHYSEFLNDIASRGDNVST